MAFKLKSVNTTSSIYWALYLIFNVDKFENKIGRQFENLNTFLEFALKRKF